MYCGNANERQDAGSDHSLAAKGSAIDLGVAGSGLVSCRFSILSSFFTIMQFSNLSFI